MQVAAASGASQAAAGGEGNEEEKQIQLTLENFEAVAKSVAVSWLDLQSKVGLGKLQNSEAIDQAVNKKFDRLLADVCQVMGRTRFEQKVIPALGDAGPPGQ